MILAPVIGNIVIGSLVIDRAGEYILHMYGSYKCIPVKQNCKHMIQSNSSAVSALSCGYIQLVRSYGYSLRKIRILPVFNSFILIELQVGAVEQGGECLVRERAFPPSSFLAGKIWNSSFSSSMRLISPLSLITKNFISSSK